MYTCIYLFVWYPPQNPPFLHKNPIAVCICIKNPIHLYTYIHTCIHTCMYTCIYLFVWYPPQNPPFLHKNPIAVCIYALSIYLTYLSFYLSIIPSYLFT